MPRPSLYLASPYGFATQWRELLLPPFVTQLEAMGAEVWEPFARNNQIDMSRSGWAHAVATADVRDVESADGFFAIINGTPPDEGVMVELGVAIALRKPIFLFRDDFRICSDSEDYPLNLMLFAGLPQQGWRDHYYCSIDELADPAKALARWLAA
jgi:nucleoside 2-deoxyribosyltransferase